MESTPWKKWTHMPLSFQQTNTTAGVFTGHFSSIITLSVDWRRPYSITTAICKRRRRGKHQLTCSLVRFELVRRHSVVWKWRISEGLIKTGADLFGCCCFCQVKFFFFVFFSLSSSFFFFSFLNMGYVKIYRAVQHGAAFRNKLHGGHVTIFMSYLRE